MWQQSTYRCVPLIRPLQKYALPLFFAQVPAQGSSTRYNAPLVSVFWEVLKYIHVCNFADRLSDRVVAVDADSTSHLAATPPQEIPGNVQWFMTNNIAVLEDGYS